QNRCLGNYPNGFCGDIQSHKNKNNEGYQIHLNPPPWGLTGLIEEQRASSRSIDIDYTTINSINLYCLTRCERFFSLTGEACPDTAEVLNCGFAALSLALFNDCSYLADHFLDSSLEMPAGAAQEKPIKDCP